jgi:hypothetical protein
VFRVVDLDQVLPLVGTVEEAAACRDTPPGSVSPRE